MYYCGRGALAHELLRGITDTEGGCLLGRACVRIARRQACLRAGPSRRCASCRDRRDGVLVGGVRGMVDTTRRSSTMWAR